MRHPHSFCHLRVGLSAAMLSIAVGGGPFAATAADRTAPEPSPFLSLSLSPNSAESHAMLSGKRPRTVDYPDTGVLLGQGWVNTASQKTTANCVIYSETKDEASEKQMELKEVTDKSSLTNQLDISAEASVSGIAGSASAKMKYVSSVKIDEEQSNFAVLARVTNGSEYVIPTKQGVIDLKPEFAKLARRDLSGFYRQCGDSFVTARMGGAELSAVLSFHVYSVDEKKALSVSVHGSGWGSIDVSGSVSQSMTKYSSTSQFSVSYHEAGGSGDPIPTDQAGLIDKIHLLPELAKSAPKYLKIEITRYDSLPSWPSKRADWLYNAYEIISSQYQRFSSLHESVVQMLQSPSEYVLDQGVTLSDLATLEAQLLARTRSVKKRARECIDSSGSDCILSEDDQVSDYTFRVRMPIRRKACPACIALDNATQDAAVKAKAYRDAIAFYAAMAESLRINEKQKFWDAQTQNERKAANNAAALVNALTAEYPEGLRSAIAAEWIEIPARARCAEDELNDRRQLELPVNDN